MYARGRRRVAFLTVLAVAPAVAQAGFVASDIRQQDTTKVAKLIDRLDVIQSEVKSVDDQISDVALAVEEVRQQFQETRDPKPAQERLWVLTDKVYGAKESLKDFSVEVGSIRRTLDSIAVTTSSGFHSQTTVALLDDAYKLLRVVEDEIAAAQDHADTVLADIRALQELIAGTGSIGG
jgi:chromosome segregation ATPase